MWAWAGSEYVTPRLWFIWINKAIKLRINKLISELIEGSIMDKSFALMPQTFRVVRSDLIAVFPLCGPVLSHKSTLVHTVPTAINVFEIENAPEGCSVNSACGHN